MIYRRRIFEKSEPTREAQKIYIFCEGGREEEYFNFFVNISTNLHIIPFGPESNQSDPEKLMRQASRIFIENDHPLTLNAEEKDLVWFAIDTDTWADEGKISSLHSFCQDNNERMRYKCWNVAQSNPSLEIWLYYHVYDKRPSEREVQRYATFKEFVDAKISGGFDCRTMPGLIKKAISNAERNYSEDGIGPSLFSTQAYLLGKDIWRYAEREILRKTRTLSI